MTRRKRWCSCTSYIPCSPPTFSLHEIVSNLLPGRGDNNFCVHIECILVKSLTFLKLIGDDLINIKHKRYDEMKKPSEVVICSSAI